MALRRFSPSALVAALNELRGSIGQIQFFGPRHQKSRERYCAGHFSAGFEAALEQCTVVFEEPDPQNEVDFYLEVRCTLHPFQVTEVQEPGRRRGDELKRLSKGEVVHADVKAMFTNGYEWIRAAILRKLSAYGGNVKDLNLLVYVNLPGGELEYEPICNALSDDAAAFASVWLMTGNAIACVRANAALGELSCWYKTPFASSEA